MFTDSRILVKADGFPGLNNSSRSAERSEFIISSRAVREPLLDPSELQTRSAHLYLFTVYPMVSVINS